MDTTALISLALKTLKCSQKELALRIGVSEGQISKWKAGEHISTDMDERLRKLAKIKPFQDAALVLAVGAKDAAKWSKLIILLAKNAAEGAETGWHTEPLEEADSDEYASALLVAEVFGILRDMGVAMPSSFPAELQPFLKDLGFGGDDEPDWAVLEDNPYVDLIQKIFSAFNDVYGYYVAYVSDAVDDEEIMAAAGTGAENIQPCLLTLAAAKIEGVDRTFAPQFFEFVYKTEKEYRGWLMDLKRAAIRGGFPLEQEIMDLVFEHHDPLGHKAEAKALGIFNDRQPHPDMYMNELVVGMRTIHQVLPAIMAKLGMTEADFTLDRSELHLEHWREAEASAARAEAAEAAGGVEEYPVSPEAADAPNDEGKPDGKPNLTVVESAGGDDGAA
jgi:transcriptional regulator with XRE-family HTH domain